MPFAIGENVGPYRIMEKLGQGGMATVFKAYHPALDRYVAIKVLHPAFQEDPNFLARFQREARIVAKLDHPHIVPIYDFAEHRGHPYLVMRFVEGETLKARLQRGAVSQELVLEVIEAVGDALSYAHAQGILHRDIKPSNIILAADGQVYLTDFGLARMAEAGESTLSRDMMVGTPQYIAPEQAKGETKLDARTDVYSLGVVLYELMVGRVPFQADTPYAIIHDHIFTPLPLPRSIKPGLAEPLERVLLKALAKEPDDRFSTVEEMVAAFREAIGPVPAEAMPETAVAPPPVAPLPETTVAHLPAEPGAAKPARKKRRWPWVVGGVAASLCLIVACLIGIDWWQQNNGPTGSVDADQLLEDARQARDDRQLVRALGLYRRAIEADPGLVSAYLEAGDLMAQVGRVGQAIPLYEEGIAATDDPELHKRLAAAAALTKQWDMAEKEVRWLMQELPGDPVSHAYAALVVLARGGPCGEARPELDTALALDPELAWAHYGLALCSLEEGDREAARAELEFVLSQDDVSALLRTRAEQQMALLDVGLEEVLSGEYDALLGLAGEIPQDELRSDFEDMVDRASRLWDEGDGAGAVQALLDAQSWLEEHWEEIGDPPAGDISYSLGRLIGLATEE